MITLKINLLQYKAVIQKVKNSSGKDVECVVIPIEMNGLIKGEKGVYADFAAFEFKAKKEGDLNTHLIKQSLPKETFQKMSDEDKKAMPIFGNLRVWAERTEAEPVSSTVPIAENDKLPWE